jgi:calcium-dependent protein kinase
MNKAGLETEEATALPDPPRTKAQVAKAVEDEIAKEVEILLRAKGSPYCVEFFEFSRTKKHYIIATQLATGGDMMGRIEHMKEPFSEAFAADWVRQMLLAVQHCHSKLVVHRCVRSFLG